MISDMVHGRPIQPKGIVKMRVHPRSSLDAVDLKRHLLLEGELRRMSLKLDPSVACAAAEVGCGSAGEQEAHEAACPLAICQDDSEDEDEEDEVYTDDAGAEGHGEVDAQELTAWAEEHGMTADDAAAVFDMMGTNGDGKVTPIWMFAHYRQTSG